MRKELVVVTGSEGFLGRHFVSTLKQEGWHVWGLDKKVGLDMRNELPKFGSGVGLLIHCAALVEGRETIEFRQAEVLTYNLQLDGVAFGWALKHKVPMIYISSSAVYSPKLQTSFEALRLVEDVASYTNKDGADLTYGYEKFVGEHMAEEVRKTGVPVSVVRPFSIYGPDQDDVYPFRAILERVRRGDDPVKVWGDGDQVRDFIHVEDAIPAILKIHETGADGPVNICTGVPTKLANLARLMMSKAGLETHKIVFDKTKVQGVQYRVGNPALMNTYYTPTITIEEGVRRALKEAA